MQRHLETWLKATRGRDPDGEPVPGYIERDFRQYLTCGILAHGFARARCASCGHDFVVAFACKGRGVCPSCTTRRMAETAARLVDHVLPRVPVRQWVLALPKRLRYFLHHDTRLVNPVLRIFLAEVEAALRPCSPDAPDGARFGAVTLRRAPCGRTAYVPFCSGQNGRPPLRFGAERQPAWPWLRHRRRVPRGRRSGTVHPAFPTDRALAKVQRQTRRRVLQLFRRRELLPADAVETMRDWEHDGVRTDPKVM